MKVFVGLLFVLSVAYADKTSTKVEQNQESLKQEKRSLTHGSGYDISLQNAYQGAGIYQSSDAGIYQNAGAGIYPSGGGSGIYQSLGGSGIYQNAGAGYPGIATIESSGPVLSTDSASAVGVSTNTNTNTLTTINQKIPVPVPVDRPIPIPQPYPVVKTVAV
jgi:hypothetical protein